MSCFIEITNFLSTRLDLIKARPMHHGMQGEFLRYKAFAFISWDSQTVTIQQKPIGKKEIIPFADVNKESVTEALKKVTS